MREWGIFVQVPATTTKNELRILQNVTKIVCGGYFWGSLSLL